MRLILSWQPDAPLGKRSALALASSARGHSVTVWNRTREKARLLEPKGIVVADSLEAAVAGADLVVGNLSDYAATTEQLGASAVTAALRDKTFVQLATGSPHQARGSAAWAREHRIRYLDGAIMATPGFIGQSDCTLLYSGEARLFEVEKEVLLALGATRCTSGRTSATPTRSTPPS